MYIVIERDQPAYVYQTRYNPRELAERCSVSYFHIRFQEGRYEILTGQGRWEPLDNLDDSIDNGEDC